MLKFAKVRRYKLDNIKSAQFNDRRERDALRAGDYDLANYYADCAFSDRHMRAE